MHDPVGADPDWTETAWIAAHVADRGLVVWLYPVFRTALGVMSCAVYVWAPGGEEPWQLPYYRSEYVLPIPEGAGAMGFALDNGLSYETTNDLHGYSARFSDGDALRVELSYEALHEPHYVGVRDGRGHIDQLGRVRGEIVLRGERIEVDCIEMRDRTWGPRRAARQRTHLGYSYAADGSGRGLQAATRYDYERDEAVFMAGFALQHGEAQPLTGARRAVERDAAGRPARLRLTTEDPVGGMSEISGEVVSRMAMPMNHYFVWASLVRWTFADGSIGWGEDQDTWSPGALQALRATS